MGNDLPINKRSQSNMWPEAKDFDSTWEDEPDETPENPDFKRRQPKAYRNSRAAEDMQKYRHKCRKTVETEGTTDDDDDDDYYNNFENLEKDGLQNVLFYKNLRSSEPDDVSIEEFHKEWKGEYERLEYVHSYIQWLFPIQEPGMNYSAFVLKPKEIKLFRKKQDLKERLLESYKLMLDFYGIELTDETTGEVKRAKNYVERFENLNRCTHNNLRITRILKCLGLLGFEHFQAPLVQFFLEETLKNGQLPRVKQSVLDYFLFAVLDPKDRKGLIRFAFEHFDPREKFVWCPERIRTKLEKERGSYKEKLQDNTKVKSKEGKATNDIEMINTFSSCSIGGEEKKSDQQGNKQIEIKVSDRDTENKHASDINRSSVKNSTKNEAEFTETPSSPYVSQEHPVTQETNSETSGDIENSAIIHMPPESEALNETGLDCNTAGTGIMKPVNLQKDPENGTKVETLDINSDDQKTTDKTTTSDTDTQEKPQIDLKTKTMVIKTDTDKDSRSTEEAPEAHGLAIKCENPTCDNEATNEIMKTKKRSSSEPENEEPKKAKQCIESSITCVVGNHDSDTISGVSGTEVQQEGSEENPNDYKPADETPGSDQKQDDMSQDHQDEEHESQSQTTDNLTEIKTSADSNTVVPQHQSGCGSEVENKESKAVNGNEQNKSPEETSGQHDSKKNDVDTVKYDICSEADQKCPEKNPKGDNSDEAKIQKTDCHSADNSTKADNNVNSDPQQTEDSQDTSLNIESGTKAAGGAVGNETEAKIELNKQEEDKTLCSDTSENPKKSESTQL